jgi:hypothetical protein
MTNLTNYVYKSGEQFYFDSENYTDDDNMLNFEFEDGDSIKWIWENKKMMGTLREEGYNLGLFILDNVSCIDV